jgi:hypothetical protein
MSLLEKNKKREFSMKKPDSTPEKSQGTFFLIVDDHSGRDEMNLAGNPFALLQAGGKSKDGKSHIKYEWNRRLTSGKTALATWEVAGHADLGLPGPSDELLYLVLLEMTREAANGGAWPQQVHFSRAALLKRLGWPDSRQYYGLLADCFARLDAVVIQARHAFYDAAQKAPLAFISFSILDGAQIADEPRGRKAQGALPLSFFKWSDRMLESFNAGNVRSLALDFVVSLRHPTAVRLFRFLDMHRNSQKPPLHEFKIGALKLRDHLGMVNLKFVSKVKERLEPAHEELIERGYLERVEYRKGAGGEVALYTFADGPKNSLPASPPVLMPMRKPAATNHPASKATPGETVGANLEVADAAQDLFPIEAHAVFEALSESERERLRQMARQGVEPAFWDRLERPDSPMGLILWEIIAREFPAQYAAQTGEGDKVVTPKPKPA